MLKETIALIKAITGRTFQPVCFRETLSVMPRPHADTVNITKVQRSLTEDAIQYMDDSEIWLTAEHPQLIKSINQHLKEAFMSMFSELQDYILKAGGKYKVSTHVYGPDGYMGHIEEIRLVFHMDLEVFIGRAKALSSWQAVTEADTYIIGRLWQVLCQTENRKLCTV